MESGTIRRLLGRAARTAAVAAALAGCGSTAQIGTTVSGAVGTAGAVATTVAPTVAAGATSIANAGGTTVAGVRPTIAAVATNVPGAVGTVVAGAQPTVGAVQTAVGGVVNTAVAGAPNLPGNLPLRVGQFARKTQDGGGRVEVVNTPGGTGVVRLGADFTVTAGPGLRVYLTREASPGTKAEVERGFVDLGPLRATSGQDVYPVPAGTDLASYAGVVIYSADGGVPYIAASLGRP